MGIAEIARGLLALLFLQTSWSYLGRQGLGLKFALLWVARSREERRRVLEHTRGALNTNPFAAGLVVGAIIRAEYESEELAAIDRRVAVLQGTIAAGGDRFFWYTLRPALTALAVFLALYRSPFAPLAFLLAFNALAQGTRAIGLRAGFAQGWDAGPLLQRRFDRWERTLALFAVFVTGMIFTRALLGAQPGMALVGQAAAPYRFGLSSWLLLPAMAVSYIALRRGLSATYLLIICLLIFLGFRLIS